MGCGSVPSALSIAVVIASMVSGGKDAFEKSFMGSNPSSFRRIFPPCNLRKLSYQCKQARRQRIGLPIQSLTNPFTDFLTDCAAMNAVDLNVILPSGI
jgi:hypothetical protein